MIRHKNGNVEYFSFGSLDGLKMVTDIFTTRLGGVSTDYHASMNLGFNNGDDPWNVRKNYEIIANVLGVNCDHIVRSKQTHTTNVRLVTEKDVYDDGVLHDPLYTDVDGLMTNVPGIALATFYADCVPLYFADPVHRAVAVSHSGWRGTVAKMGEVTVCAMKDAFGTEPEDIYAAIGPSICRDCYEVSGDVAERFEDAFGEHACRMIYPGRAEGKYQLDLWEANRTVLMEAGVKPDRIETASLCTSCNNDLLFSHRAQNGKRGNLAAFIMLK